MRFVYRSKYFCLLSDSGRHWHPPSPCTKWYIYTVYITQITNFINNIIPNEYTFKSCSIFQHFPWWLHGSEHPVYSLCSLQTYIMYLIKYLAITIYFSVMSNKLLPYHIFQFTSLFQSQISSKCH